MDIPAVPGYNYKDISKKLSPSRKESDLDVTARTDMPSNAEHAVSTQETTMLELINQVGRLALNVQNMSCDLQAVKEKQNGLAVVAPSIAEVTRSQFVPAVPAVMGASGGLPAGANATDASNAVVEAVVCLPSGAKVNNKILRAARSGEFVNLCDFAPVLEPSTMTETSIVDGELVFKAKRTIKTIDSFLLWSMAWAAYEGILVEADPTRYAKLCAYRCFIQVCAAKYFWNAVYGYDVRNRACKSMTKSLEFQSIDQDIYVSNFDATTSKTNVRQCTRCRSIWHNVRDCPFPEEGPVAANTRQAGPASHNPQSRYGGGGNQPGRGRSQQICFNFNAGRCSNNPCARLHQCERCGGPDPLPRCARCNSGAQIGSTPSSQSGGGQPGGRENHNTFQQSRMG
jgi:hypothetical protein